MKNMAGKIGKKDTFHILHFFLLKQLIKDIFSKHFYLKGEKQWLVKSGKKDSFHILHLFFLKQSNTRLASKFFFYLKMFTTRTTRGIISCIFEWQLLL